MAGIRSLPRSVVNDPERTSTSLKMIVAVQFTQSSIEA